MTVNRKSPHHNQLSSIVFFVVQKSLQQQEIVLFSVSVQFTLTAGRIVNFTTCTKLLYLLVKRRVLCFIGVHRVNLDFHLVAKYDS